MDSFSEITQLFLKKRIAIFSTTLLFFIIAIFYSLSLKDIYESDGVYLIRNDSGQDQSNIGSLSILAGISGQSGNNKSKIIRNTLYSRDFFKYFYNDNALLAIITDIDEYQKITKDVRYNNFNILSNEWALIDGKTSKPSFEDAQTIFENSLSYENKDGPEIIKIKFNSRSPYAAKKILEVIVSKINEDTRNFEKNDTNKSIKFFKDMLSNQNEVYLNDAYAALLEQRVKSLELIEIYEDFSLKTIESPSVPEKKIKPKRTLVVVFFSAFGFILSLLLIASNQFLINLRKRSLKNSI